MVTCYPLIPTTYFSLPIEACEVVQMLRMSSSYNTYLVSLDVPSSSKEREG